jgi:L-lactate utilization protein LutC
LGHNIKQQSKKGRKNLNLDDIADETLIQKVAKVLSERTNIEVSVFDDHSQGLEALKKMIPIGSDVYTGPSETLNQIGFTEHVREGGKYNDLRARVLAEPDYDKRRDIRREVSTADFFVASVHAIVETGEVVIVSGSGSQLAGYAAGARNVIWVAGSNKIVPNMDIAMRRVREHSLPLEDARVKAAGGSGSAIGKILIIERESVESRIRLVLIRQSLGF